MFIIQRVLGGFVCVGIGSSSCHWKVWKIVEFRKIKTNFAFFCFL